MTYDTRPGTGGMYHHACYIQYCCTCNSPVSLRVVSAAAAAAARADDTGAQSLKHAVVGLSAALFLALMALTWVAVARKYLNRDVAKENPTAADGPNGGAGGGGGEGSGGDSTEQNNSSGERTRTGSPDSVVVEAKMRRQVSELSLRSLRSCRSLDNMELQTRT